MRMFSLRGVRHRWLPVALLPLSLLLGVPKAEAGDRSTLQAGLAAYFDGRFDESAVQLKRAAMATAGNRDSGLETVAAYFLGRAFHELGLRGLALHYLGEAERSGSEDARRLALREIARIYFRAAEYSAVIETFRRLRPEEQDDEIAYLAGISASMERKWREAQEILGRIRPENLLGAAALYARAQARAAAEDVAGALADLETVVAMPDPAPTGIHDQARILSGKLLYLEGKDEKARGFFAAVERQGRFGFEATRGLLLTGASPARASEIPSADVRPEAAATLLLVRATAAEERGDAAGATALRAELREMAGRSRKALDRLAGTGGAARAMLETDLSRFASLLGRKRWAEGCVEEARLLAPELARPLAANPSIETARFRPKEGVFYPVWEQARRDPWLRGLIEILARADTLASELRLDSRPRPFWAFWRNRVDDRPRLALRVIRAANLGQILADHRHVFHASNGEALRAAKQESVAAALMDLERLYRGAGGKALDALSNLGTALEYKRSDMLRLIESVPERATDPVISLLGNYVDLLAEFGERAEPSGKLPPLDDSTRSEILERILRRNSVLRSEVAGEIHGAIEPTLRRETALITRIEADNEGSLSKLYARTGAAVKREEEH